MCNIQEALMFPMGSTWCYRLSTQTLPDCVRMPASRKCGWPHKSLLLSSQRAWEKLRIIGCYVGLDSDYVSSFSFCLKGN